MKAWNKDGWRTKDKKLIMLEYRELTKQELIQLNGGMNLLNRIGYAIGAAAANTVDFAYGVVDGINEAFRKE